MDDAVFHLQPYILPARRHIDGRALPGGAVGDVAVSYAVVHLHLVAGCRVGVAADDARTVFVAHGEHIRTFPCVGIVELEPVNHGVGHVGEVDDVAGVVLIAVGRHLGGDACGMSHGVAHQGASAGFCAGECSGETAIEAHIGEHVDGGGA